MTTHPTQATPDPTRWRFDMSALGIRMVDMSEAAGVSISWLSDAAAGKLEPSTERVERIESILSEARAMRGCGVDSSLLLTRLVPAPQLLATPSGAELSGQLVRAGFEANGEVVRPFAFRDAYSIPVRSGGTRWPASATVEHLYRDDFGGLSVRGQLTDKQAEAIAGYDTIRIRFEVRGRDVVRRDGVDVIVMASVVDLLLGCGGDEPASWLEQFAPNSRRMEGI